MRILKWLGMAVAGTFVAAVLALGLGYALTDPQFEVAATVNDDPSLPTVRHQNIWDH
jgi:hypothetical protein